VREVNQSALSALLHRYITLRGYLEMLIEAAFSDVPPN
jgi:hypothetical protein